MLKRFISVLVLLCSLLAVAPNLSAQGVTVSSTTTTAGVSSTVLFAAHGNGVRFSLSGTWVGTMYLMRSDDAGQSYIVVGSYTANIADTLPPLTNDTRYKWFVNAYTSGTISYMLGNLDNVKGLNAHATVPVGSVAYSSFGTDTTQIAGTTWFATVFVGAETRVAGIAVLTGSVTSGTTNDYIIGALYNSEGKLIANTDTAGTVQSTANAFQTAALTNAITIPAGRYWIGVQTKGTTNKIRTIAASTFINVLTGSVTGTFGTLPSTITTTTTFTANVGPIAYIYAP